LIAPGKLHPLWFSPWLPVLFWISAIAVGLGMVVVESNLSARGFKRGWSRICWRSLSKANLGLLTFYVLAKLADVVWRGQALTSRSGSLQTVLWWVEVGIGAMLPAILMLAAENAGNKNLLLMAGALVVAAASSTG
jgi:Ni/Fe-hydrogenase subunit HybB-like protein